jgi:hypothetical protein
VNDCQERAQVDVVYLLTFSSKYRINGGLEADFFFWALLHLISEQSRIENVSIMSGGFSSANSWNFFLTCLKLGIYSLARKQNRK